MTIRRRQISFRQTIVILCALAAVVPMFVLAIPFVAKLTVSMGESADRELRLVADSVERELQFQLSQIISQSRSLTQDGDIGRAVRSILFLNRADIQLRNLLTQHQVIAGAYLLNIRQEIVTAYPDRLIQIQLPVALMDTARNTMKSAENQKNHSLVVTALTEDPAFANQVDSSSVPILFYMTIPVPGVMDSPAGALVIVVSMHRLNQLANGLAHPPTEIDLKLLTVPFQSESEANYFGAMAPVKWPSPFEDPRALVVTVREPSHYRLAAIKTTALRWSGLAVLLAMVFGLLGYRLSRSLSAPLALLTSYAEAFGKKDYSVSDTRSRFSDFSAMFLAFADMAKRVEQQVADERARVALELNVLRNQMSPHFLFNSLNSVATMITIDQAEATSMVTKLSDLYRSILNASKSTTWSLQTEMDLVRNYLALESIRFAERLQYSIEIPTELQNIQVPPLLVQTLVENAIKHGIAPSREGGRVWIKAKSTGPDWCHFTIANSGAPFKPMSSNSQGTGLLNSKLRLDMLYGGDSHFHIGPTEDGTSTVTFRMARGLHQVQEDEK